MLGQASMFVIASRVFLCDCSSLGGLIMPQVFVWVFESERGGGGRSEEEKWNKMTVSECCFICMLTSTYICRSGKLDTDGFVYAVLTPMVISHIVMFVIKNNNLYFESGSAACTASLLTASLATYYLHNIQRWLKSCLEFGDWKCVGILFIVSYSENLYFESQNDSWVGGTTEWFIDHASQTHPCDWRKITNKWWWGIASSLRLMSKKTHRKITFLSFCF